MDVDIVPILLASGLSKLFSERYQRAEKERQNYLDKVEAATGDDVFKYLLLIDVAALDSYTTQTRLQAEQSFGLSKLVGLLGFCLLTLAIAFGVYSQLFMPRGLQIAYVAAAGGAITEFISGVFFYLYTSTLKQINLFHRELQLSRRISTGLLLTGLVQDATSREGAKLDLARKLIHERETDSSREAPAANRRKSRGGT